MTEPAIDEDRVLRSYEDVLAIEWDEDSGTARIVTIRDVYHAIPSQSQHSCPDREYHDQDICKHLFALETIRGNSDAPEGWLVVDNLDSRGDDPKTVPDTETNFEPLSEKV